VLTFLSWIQFGGRVGENLLAFPLIANTTITYCSFVFLGIPVICLGTFGIVKILLCAAIQTVLELCKLLLCLLRNPCTCPPPPMFYVDSKHVCNYIFRLQSNTKDCFVERMVWQKTSCSGFFTFIYVNYCNPSFLLSVLWMYIPSLNLGLAGLESKLASTAQEVHYTSTASCLAEAQGCMLVGIQGF